MSRDAPSARATCNPARRHAIGERSIAAVPRAAYANRTAAPRNAVPAVNLGGREYPMRISGQQHLILQGSSEVALNQRVKQLIQKLGEAIHESVSESEHIAGVVKNIRDQGFDVMLMLEATIGLNQVEDESAEAAESSDEDAPGQFTRNDLSFLKSLRITLPEEESNDSIDLRLD